MPELNSPVFRGAVEENTSLDVGQLHLQGKERAGGGWNGGVVGEGEGEGKVPSEQPYQLTYCLYVDGGKHVLQHGSHELGGLVTSCKIVQHQLRKKRQEVEMGTAIIHCCLSPVANRGTGRDL